MAKKESSTYIEILKDIENNKYSPIYFLMGEEPYFIDIITEKLEETVIKEEEKDFNLTILYGADTDINQILNAARRFPMMSNYQLVIVKEAQLINDIEKLELYTKNLLPSNSVVINYKYKKFDLRKKVMKDISEKGILFDSKKIYDDKIPDFILSYVKGKSLQIDAKSAIMLSNFIGNNISRLCSAIYKLAVVLGKN